MSGKVVEIPFQRLLLDSEGEKILIDSHQGKIFRFKFKY